LGSAREAIQGAVRFAPRRERRTLPVSFVIVFRGGNCDWRERRAYAMAVGGCFRRDKYTCSCEKARIARLKEMTLSLPFREDIFAERHR
jgi:hypothetical protein